jgi:hypothetical protein
LVGQQRVVAERNWLKRSGEREVQPTSPLSLAHDFVHQPAAVRRFVHSDAVTQYLQRQHGDLCYGRHGMVHFMCYKKRQRQACGVDVVVDGSVAGEMVIACYGHVRGDVNGKVLHDILLRALQIQMPT